MKWWKAINKYILMNKEELNKFINDAKIIIKLLKSNKALFYKLGIYKIKFEPSGSIEKHLVIKNTKDIDMYLEIYINKNKFITKDLTSDKAKQLKDQIYNLIYKKILNMKKNMSQERPTIDINLYDDKLLSLVLIFIDANNKNSAKYIIRKDQLHINNKDKFYEKIKSINSKNKRRKILAIIRLYKFIMSSSFDDHPKYKSEIAIIDYISELPKNTSYFNRFVNMLSNDNFLEQITSNFKSNNINESLIKIKNRQLKIINLIKENRVNSFSELLKLNQFITCYIN